MRIIEVRDGFLKIETSKELALSSFLEIDSVDKKYIAQIVQNQKAGEVFVVYAKILFLYDGILEVYDKSLPKLTSEISKFSYEKLTECFQYTDPVVIGEFVGENAKIQLDKSNLNAKTIVCIDNPENSNIFISNLQKSLSKFGNTLVIDMLGITRAENIFRAGIDFKLALNTENISFMYEDCLNDATSDSKALIKEVFTDLSNYCKTVPFVPFATLKKVIDDMVDKSHIFKLLILKNKLSKFDRQGYFAATSEEALNLSKILHSTSSILDLSKLDTLFQNRYLASIFSEIKKQNLDLQIILIASNTINKNNIKKLFENNDNSSVFMTHSKFKYLTEMLPLFENYIIEPSFNSNTIFKPFKMFLNNMQKDSFLIIGSGTNNIPFMSKFEHINIDVQEIVDIIEDKEDEVEITEEDLESNINLTEDVVKDAQTLAIEKKSEDLFERIAEDINNEDSVDLELFSDEENSETEVSDEESITETEIEADNQNTIVEEMEQQDLSNDISDSELNSIISTEQGEFIENIEMDTDLATETTDEPLDNSENEVIDTSVEIEELATDMSETTSTEPMEEVQEDKTTFEVKTEAEENENLYHTEIDEFQTIEISEEISDLAEEAETEIYVNEINEENIGNNITIETALESESNNIEEPYESNNFEEIELKELNDLDESEEADAEVVIELEDFDDNEDLDKEIIEDVDKVFTTMKEDTILDSDLDFIDELNDEDNDLINETTGFEEIPEFVSENNDENEDFIEPLEEINDSDKFIEEKEVLQTKSSQNTIIPVYDAEIPEEDIVTSDSIEQGDVVTHSKYGTGVVEKMIKYGTKTLFSINFDNIGRRLLDPTLTELKKN